ncbi:copper amine oxidase N-terminal domain-containing protein [Paenibacillus sp. PL2-23]|uniref:copper amine oxidase N-terminal domain-containing protein n=1 Tax=Paenibacillus sp. PL2-23 TaxID=2100729 RepID=UPI0030F67D0C
MLTKKMVRAASLLLLALLITIAAGCQSYGGVDFNQTLKNGLTVTSVESKGVYELELHMDEAMLDSHAEYYGEEEAALLRLFSNIQLELHQSKLQDETRMSMDGVLKLGSQESLSIGFQTRMDGETLAIELEGAKAPLTLDLTGEELLQLNGLEAAAMESPLEPAMDEETMTQIGFELMDIIGDYSIGNLPNPSNLKVAPVSLPIGGKDTALLRASFTMSGDELWTWIQTYVEALIADRNGLDAMVERILDVVDSNPELWALIGGMNPMQTGFLDAPTEREMIEEASEAILDSLVTLQEELEAIHEEEQAMLESTLFGDALQLKHEMYVDHKMDIRKQTFELTYSQEEPAEEELSMGLPISGFTIRGDIENWNVNGPVVADQPDNARETIALEQVQQGFQLMKHVEKGSDLYTLLTEGFHLNRQTYNAYTYSYRNPPIIMPGFTSMVAVRDVADALGAEVEYNGSTRRVAVKDPYTNTTIEFTPGDDQVLVNGELEEWPIPPFVINWTTYVHARKLAEALGADIEWTGYPGGGGYVTIQREI